MKDCAVRKREKLIHEAVRGHLGWVLTGDGSGLWVLALHGWTWEFWDWGVLVLGIAMAQAGAVGTNQAWTRWNPVPPLTAQSFAHPSMSDRPWGTFEYAGRADFRGVEGGSGCDGCRRHWWCRGWAGNDLMGLYDFHLTWVRDSASGDAGVVDNSANFRDVLKQQLGLKLKNARAPVHF